MTDLVTTDGDPPELLVEYEALKLETARVQEIGERLVSDINQCGDKYKLYFPEMLSALQDIDSELEGLRRQIAMLEDESAEEPDAPEQEEATAEQPSSVKEKKKAARLIYGRISNLCHPDKTRGLPEELREQLTHLYITARILYKHKNEDGLLTIYAEAMTLRSDGTPGSKNRVKETVRALVEALRKQLQNMHDNTESIKHHPMYHVYRFHSDQQYDKSKALFHQILKATYRERELQRDELQKELWARRNDAEWDTL